MIGKRDLSSVRLLRLAAIVAALVAAALLVATIAIHRSFDEAQLRRALEPRLARALKAPVTIGTAELSLWPAPRIVLGEVASANASIAVVEARLSGTSLLQGTLRPKRLDWRGGTIDLDALGLADASAAATFFEGLDLGRVDFENVTLTAFGETALVAEGRLERRGERVGASGRVTWRDRVVELAVSSGSFTDLATLGPLTLRLDAPDLTFEFAGTGSVDGLGAGRLSLSGPSLASALAWLGRPSLGATDAGFSLEGRVSDTAWGWELAGAELALAGTAAEGSIGIVRGDRPRVTGTLALDAIDTDLAAMRKAAAGLAPGLDADLRFSAPRLRIASAELVGAAAALRSDRSRVRLELSDARYATGRATAELDLPRHADAAPGRLTLRLSDVDVVDVPIRFPEGAPGLDGRVDLAVTLSPVPDTLAEAERIEMRVEARDGRLENLDLRAIARLGRDLIEGAATGGDTPFETLEADLILTPGLVEIGDGRVAAPGLAARFDGRLDLERRVPTIRAEVAAVDMIANVEEPVALGPRAMTVFVTGTLDAPLIVPVDPERR